MKVYEFALPVENNDRTHRYTAERDKWHAAAIELAGGCTRFPGVQGSWRDNDTGRLYFDRMVPYRVACDYQTSRKLLVLAFELFADQLAIFITEIGEATIINRPVHLKPPAGLTATEIRAKIAAYPNWEPGNRKDVRDAANTPWSVGEIAGATVDLGGGKGDRRQDIHAALVWHNWHPKDDRRQPTFHFTRRQGVERRAEGFHGSIRGYTRRFPRRLADHPKCR